MTARFGGQALPMCGFSIGFERVMELIDPNELTKQAPRVAVVCTGEAEMLACLARCRLLRAEEPGATDSVVRRARNARKQREDLERLGYSVFVSGAELLAQ